MLRTMILLALMLAQPAIADGVAPRAGWQIVSSDKPYGALVKSLIGAVKANGLFVVTQAGPTAAAKRRGINLPGNRVIGVFNNRYAVRVLRLSTAAMIEAPIRFYVTEEPDGTGTVSYKTPSHVFAPYLDEGGAELAEIARELDARFAQIAEAAR